MNYQIVHSIAGRLRLRIPRLCGDIDFANRLNRQIESLAGVTDVRINSAACSIVITYEARNCEIMQQQVLTCLWKSDVADLAATIDPPESFEEAEPEVNHWQDLGLPAVSLAVALLAVPLELPAIVVGSAIAGAAMPWFVRATESLVTQRQPNVDLLDSLWMTLQTLQGQYAAPALKTCLVEVRRALRGTTAEQRERAARAILEEFDRPRWIELNGERKWMAVGTIQPGDRVVVHSGESIPVDGWVLEGTALINEQNLTGENIPVVCSVGQAVYATTQVLEGKLCIVAEQVGCKTRIGIVAQLTLSAPVHDTEIGVLQAEFLRSAIFPTILFGGAMFALTGNFGAAVSPFQLDFGSGIPISVHTTLLSALTYSASHGIYIRSARTLELLSRLDAIVFDQTGLLDPVGRLRAESQTTIAELQRQGIEIYWVTQEHHSINIPQPHICEKTSPEMLVSGLRHQGKTVAFVGSHELAAIQADVSISFAAQPDGSDVVLMHEDLRGLIEAIAIAQRAIQVVYENTAMIVLPNLLIQIGGGMILGVNPVVNVITNNSSAFVAEFVHGARPLFDRQTPTPIASRRQKSRKTIQQGTTPALQTAAEFLRQGELARRLGVPFQTLTPQRSKPEFKQWAQKKDPEGKAWQYDATLKGFYAIES
ncbi:HAD-IC family P-type ATPase [Leptolyngbya sp. NIES-2104]|uniref:HAD-IC family P-type ATPase n=1 Tax=Leptolyngbya sp. NIES-2104 TaxID=1552121 RepID=UPI0006ECB18D|nr:HAD-IC family P-type ATPase [Leptolyngbya sp. NIES-2104]GAP94835.1 cation-transporting ATPase [Leptolyngbya sp. NIES-2104]